MSFIEIESDHSRSECLSEAMLVPAGVSARAKEVGSLIVVDAVDLLATGGKEGNHFGSDEAGGASDKKLHAYNLWVREVGVGKGIFGPATYLTPRSRSPDRVGVETQRANRDSGVKGVKEAGKGELEGKIRNSEFGNRKAEKGGKDYWGEGGWIDFMRELRAGRSSLTPWVAVSQSLEGRTESYP